MQIEQEGRKKRESPEYFLLRETIDMVVQLGKELEKGIEQNTKREIKEISRKMRKQVNTFEKSDILKWLAQFRYEQDDGPLTLDMDTQTSPKRNLLGVHGKQTAAELGQKKCPTCKRAFAQVDSGTQTKAWSNGKETICSSLGGVDNYKDWSEIAKMGWDEALYKNSEVVQGNPLHTKATTVKVVLIEPTDIKMERGIQLIYRQRYPELGDATEDFAVLEQSSRWRRPGATAASQKVVRIVQGQEEADLWNRLAFLKKETVEDEWVAIHSVERCSIERLRKMVEAIFHGGNTNVAIYTSQKRATSQQTTRERAPALIVNTEGRSYSDVLGELKAKLKDKEAAEIIKTIKRTKNDNVIIVTERGKARIQALKKAIEGEDAKLRVRDTTKEMEAVHIRGLDSTTTREDVTAELRTVLGSLDDADVKISELRPNAGSTQALTIRLEKAKAEQLLQRPYLQVGLSRARMERRFDVPRCWRCWEYSHTEADCAGPDRRKLCFRCGKEGHAAKGCNDKTVCLVCNSGHLLGTSSCASFRRALSQLRRGKSQTNTHTQSAAPIGPFLPPTLAPTAKARGAILQEWILANGLVILNEGDTPTFQNANGTSIIDFTAATEQLGRRVDKWRVEPDIENFGDHNNIYFEVSCKPGENTTRPSQAGWTIKPAAITELAAAWKTSHQTKRGQYNTIRTLTSDIVKLLDKYGHKKSSSSGRPPVYWWNADIANLR
ncbi:hypothetical protein HUJ05_004328, partial [Dendroctonus ponderosae]